MKIKTLFILLAVMMIAIAAILLPGCQQRNNPAIVKVNEKIIQIKDFSVNSDSTELKTSAKGTIFVKGAEGVPEHIQIVVWIEIDPDDRGGVAVYVPKKWYIANVISSFPEKKAEAIPGQYVSSWATASDDYKWQKFIEIGRTAARLTPKGGGAGTVVIDLVPENTIQQSETFDITVTVGSDGNAIGTDSTSIKIP